MNEQLTEQQIETLGFRYRVSILSYFHIFEIKLKKKNQHNLLHMMMVDLNGKQLFCIYHCIYHWRRVSQLQ